ncbi:MAG: hypothetical protein CMJ47_00905 [Planctomyces sp.]|nr:hypothetical protein [Planctomyces sp.]
MVFIGNGSSEKPCVAEKKHGSRPNVKNSSARTDDLTIEAILPAFHGAGAEIARRSCDNLS